MENQRNRKKLEGIVVSDKMNKTIVVEIERIQKHPLYGKAVWKNRKYKAHDEKGECRIGDRVSIEETRPLSKEKRWIVVSVIERAKIIDASPQAGKA